MSRATVAGRQDYAIDDRMELESPPLLRRCSGKVNRFNVNIYLARFHTVASFFSHSTSMRETLSNQRVSEDCTICSAFGEDVAQAKN
jgi:hypothetical protein